MKLSPYHVYVPHNSTNQCILYSTVNGTGVCISDSLYHQLLSEVTPDELSQLPEELADILLKYFLIDDEETYHHNILHSISLGITSRKRFALTVLTTLQCNFSCVYCYQNGIFQNRNHMDLTTASLTLQWLDRKLETIAPRSFELHLYGGEPLLNPSALWPILQGARKSAEQYSIQFGAYITTNGYFLTPKIARRLDHEGVRTALVSLDGPPKIHNSRRPLASGKGTFYKILNNICSASPELNICIRINLDKQNSKTIPELFRILSHRNLQDKILIDLEVVSPILLTSPHIRHFLFQGEDDLREIETLWQECADYGFRIFGAMPIEGACEHKSIHTFTVDPKGQLYECPGFVGLPEFQIGNVKDDNVQSPRSGQINRPWLECAGCPYLPICQGGCRMCNYVTKGELQSPFCKRNFFDRTYPSFLKAKYLHKLKRQYSKKMR